MMKKNKLISVIIPSYNEERYIGECLKSLINQTYTTIEIIVVDDGSTDETVNVINKFEVKIFKQNHSGPALARNYGASKAKGKILVFLDADMKYDEEYIEALVKPIIDEKAIGAFNKDEFVANTKNIWSNCWAINSDLPLIRRNKGKLPDYLSVYRAILKKEFDRVGGFDSLGYSDDGTLSEKLGVKAFGVSGAKAFHYNPETLSEVFYSARWIGRGMQDKKNIRNFLRYTLPNSIRNGLRKVKKGAPLEYIEFKIVFDFGMFSGIFLSFGKKSK